MTSFAKLKWPSKWPDHISPTNLVLAPIKQHFGCCVVVPLLLKLLGGVALVQAFIHDPAVELVVLGIMLPIAVYVILRGEDAWRARHAKRHVAQHDPCDHDCAHTPASFKKRYAVNLFIAAAIALTLHLLFHHHGA